MVLRLDFWAKDFPYQALSLPLVPLHIRDKVPDIDASTFQKLALDANKECPISRILRDGLDIKIDADLIGP